MSMTAEQREKGKKAFILADCECLGWARTETWLITTHHPDCKKGDGIREAAEIIRALCKGIEAWAADEDGVHPECWEAYRVAKGMLGQQVSESQP